MDKKTNKGRVKRQFCKSTKFGHKKLQSDCVLASSADATSPTDRSSQSLIEKGVLLSEPTSGKVREVQKDMPDQVILACLFHALGSGAPWEWCCRK